MGGEITMEKIKQIRLDEIANEIKKQENKRIIGIVLVIISIFCLWPLVIVGIILWVGANKKINELLDEKHKIQMETILSKEDSIDKAKEENIDIESVQQETHKEVIIEDISNININNEEIKGEIIDNKESKNEDL